MHNFKFHIHCDFLAYCTRPVSVDLVMACVGCLFDSFSVFLLSLVQQNLMKIMFSLSIFQHGPIPPPPPPPKKKREKKEEIFYVFYTGKLYGLTGML